MIERTALDGVVIVRAPVFRDERGVFRETWREEEYRRAGIDTRFVQDNVSISHRHVLRGLHLQHPDGQAKLIGVLAGAVWDVAVDVRRGSPAFGRWFGCELSADNGAQLFIPAGFAHGFVTLADETVVAYKCSDYYRRESELSVRWDDAELGIDWPVRDPIISEKDRAAPRLAQIPPERLPAYEP